MASKTGARSGLSSFIKEQLFIELAPVDDGRAEAAEETLPELTVIRTANLGSGPNIAGTPGNDRLFGTNRAEVIAGNKGHDFISGLDGNDFLLGNDGRDEMYGGRGRDNLRGGRDNDILFGGAGDDELWGELGTDVLWGGTGADTFVFTARTSDAVDTIMDFSPQDRIRLEGFESQDVSVRYDHHFAYVAIDGIDIARVLLGNVHHLHASDFEFV